jgi:hypothetical protein
VPACDVPRRLACRRECDDGPRATLDRVGIVQDHDHHESELRGDDHRRSAGDDHDVAGHRERRFERRWERKWHDHDHRADHDEFERSCDHGTAEHLRTDHGAAHHGATHHGATHHRRADDSADHAGDHGASTGHPVATRRTRPLISP